MALSDYAQLVVDHNENSVSGRIELPNGKAFQFYKNWLYLYDSIEAEYCCATIYGKSSVNWHGVTIETWPTKHQRGLMGIVSYGWGGDKVSWAGIAVSAYPAGLFWDIFGSIKNYCGVAKKTAQEFNYLVRKKFLNYIILSGHPSIFGHPLCEWLPFTKNLWISRAHFFIDHKVSDDTFREFDFTRYTYRNPGDDYINTHFGVISDGLKPGKTKKPIAHTLIETL